MPFSLARLRALFLKTPFFSKNTAAKAVGQKLYALCVAQARQPVFYLDYGVEDAIGARFELLCLHVTMAVLALRAVPADDPRHSEAHETGQALFDAFLGALDNTLREQGVGDLTVPKKMKKLGTVIYTRMKRWEELWSADAPLDDQAAYAARTIFAGAELGDADDGDEVAIIESTPQIVAFAAYADAARRGLTAAGLIAGRAGWAPVPALDVPEAMEA